ncbi:MAG: glycosyltransferase family 4 protein [Actinomycetota bacterium]
MSDPDHPLRIALLSYRGHPHVGGQGVYVHYLSRALVELGHRVEVLSGPPYPELAGGVEFGAVPSLDLYRPEDPFRRPRLREFRSPVDAIEYGLMCSAAFPEPLTFSLRVARILRRRADAFDVVHDNQCLGYGLLRIQRRLPVLATIHHPITIDRRHDLERASGAKRAVALRRWYSFTRMQGRVARRLEQIIAVSETAGVDVVREFGVGANRVRVVHNGVDPDLFRPLPEIDRRPGRIITLASSTAPMKGLPVLIEAVAKLATEREVELVIVGKGGDQAATALAGRFGISRSVTTPGRVDDLELVELFGTSEIAIVPSLYEGFSLPAIEAMACGLPVVATTGGALPEVVGRDGDTAVLVPPGDAAELAVAIGRLLDDEGLRARIGDAGRRRVLQKFTWRAAARATVERYRELLSRC